MRILLLMLFLVTQSVRAGNDNKEKIEIDDFVSIQILEDKKEAVVQLVSEDGQISCPYVGLLVAKSKTCAELASSIETKLTRTYFKFATVLIKIVYPPRIISCFSRPATVGATGNVTKPGKYDLLADVTVSQLITLSGGTMVTRAVPRIRIIRRTPIGEKTIIVNAKAVLVEKRAEYDLFLRPYDVLIVE